MQILWFSAMFPYAVLSILFVKAVSLEGAADGIGYLFTPKWELLKEPQVWIGELSLCHEMIGIINYLLSLRIEGKF